MDEVAVRAARTEARHAFHAAWRDTIVSLGTGAASEVLVAGPYAHALADELPVPTADEGGGLAVLGPEGFPIESGASPLATGLPDASVDSAVVLSAWPSVAGIVPVVAEMVRVVRPGGRVWLGEPALDVLTRSMPATYRAGLLYQTHPGVAARVRAAAARSGDLGVEMVRHRLRDVTVVESDLPVAVFANAAEGVEAVRSGIWPGTEQLNPVELDELLDDVRASLQHRVRFPVIEYQPWTLARGRRES